MVDVITAVKPHPTKPGQGFVRIQTDAGELEAWTPEFSKVEGLNGKPIPEGWTLKDGPYGPQLLPPKQQGGGGFRNTREAFELEAAGRLRWQAVEEDRKDRRTAIMTAFERASENEATTDTLELASRIYSWLSKSPPVAEPGEGRTADTGPGEVLASTSPGSTYAVLPGDCDHKAASGRDLPLTAEGRCPRCGEIRS